MKHLIGAVCAAAILTLAGMAQAANLDFGLYGERFTEGYVTGEFLGLADSGDSTPTGIAFTVYPYYGDFSPFYEYLSAADLTMTGSFDIEGGALAPSIFSFTEPGGENSLSVDMVAGNYVGDFAGKDIYSYASDEITEGGYMTISVSSAPEPGAWSLLIAGMGGLGGILRLHRRKTFISA